MTTVLLYDGWALVQCIGRLMEDKHHHCTVQRSGPASAQVGAGCSNNMQLQPPPTRSGPVEWSDAAVEVIRRRACRLNF